MNNIKLNHLSFSYGDKIIFNDLTFTFPSVGLFVIYGRSGEGKTTLISLLANILKPTSGTIENNDRENISLLFQSSLLLNYLTVEENCLLPCLLNKKDKKKSKEKCKELLNKVNLSGFENKDVKKLSGGEQSRVSLTRALIENKHVLILDEPTGQLDEKTSIEIYKLIKEISKDHLVILVTHDELNTKELADYLYYLKDGKLLNLKSSNAKYDCSEEKKKTKKENIRFIDALNHQKKYLKNKKIRVLLTSIFLGIEFLFIYLGFSLYKNAPTFLNSLVKEHYSYETLTIKEKRVVLKDGNLKLEKYYIPDENLLSLLNIKEQYVSLNFFVPPLVPLTLNNKDNNVSLLPTLQQNKDKLLTGNISKYPNEVIVNQSFLNVFNLTSDSIINKDIIFHHKAYFKAEDDYETINFDYSFKVKGISNEKAFLNKAIIYYDYFSLLEIIENTKLDSLSKKYETSLYLKDYLYNNKYLDEDFMSHESIIYVKDLNEINTFCNKYFKDDISLESNALTIMTTSNEVLDSILKISILFLILNIISSSLLEFLSITSLYEDNIRLFALLKVFTNNKKNRNIFIYTLSYIYFRNSFLTLFITSIIGEEIINLVLKKANYPILFMSYDYSLLFLLALLMVFISIISAFLPLRKITDSRIKKELEGED